MPTIGTLENPPEPDTEEGPAWELPELKNFIESLAATTALFNTCAFQDKEKYKWLKPERFTGCLRNAGETLHLPKLG